MRIIICLLLLLSLALPVGAEPRNILIDTVDSTSVYLDTQTVKIVQPKIFDVWIELRNSNESDYDVLHWQFDFDNKKVKQLFTAVYDSNGHIKSSTSVDKPWQDIIPNSNAEHWLRQVMDFVVKNQDEVFKRSGL
ncbi:hypothetical protein [Sporomusa sp.]|uniref:hypothetical protein n=1 Tax=Sporomusa sp. TaxID=2078658 RepID=UPI002BE97E60|nr:hypothetical protein [Sporomusa sp.]HWR45293.1 hypothetical protein [Sporomusa sp.]